MPKNNGGSAFPVTENPEAGHFPGMTMRQYYKAVALQGILASLKDQVEPVVLSVKTAARLADEMIAEDEQFEKGA